MAEIENLKIGNGGTLHIVGNEDIVANAWQAGKTYVKNKSYAIQEHRLYVCNVTHTSVEPFDATKWTEITIGDAIGNNIGDLSQLTTSDNSSLVGAVNEVDAKKANKSGMFKIQTFTRQYSISGNGSVNFDRSFITIPTGYVIGAVLEFTSNQGQVAVVSIRPNNASQWAFELVNTSSSSRDNLTFTITILFIKSDLVS